MICFKWKKEIHGPVPKGDPSNYTQWPPWQVSSSNRKHEAMSTFRVLCRLPLVTYTHQKSVLSCTQSNGPRTRPVLEPRWKANFPLVSHGNCWLLHPFSYSTTRHFCGASTTQTDKLGENLMRGTQFMGTEVYEPWRQLFFKRVRFRIKTTVEIFMDLRMLSAYVTAKSVLLIEWLK